MNEVINWIKNERTAGRTWEELRYAGEDSEQGLIQFLTYNTRRMHWPNLSADEWYQLIKEKKTDEERLERLIDTKGATIIHAANETNLINVPTDENSAWQCYRNLLLKKGFSPDVVNVMEDANIRILRQLSSDTQNSDTIKGLVIGNVQSGKTANMAALMAMAADAGWNMFIVMSGMMENLRIQTLRRLIEDLNSNSANLYWEALDNPNSIEQYGKRLCDKNFSEQNNTRYLSVCLKNSSRLRNLIDWLNTDSNSRRNIRLLIIDDEADQASINTAKKERTVINKLILNLINNRDSKGKDSLCKFKAINYIGYTATPYANVLNEAPGKESLYPANFITTLSVSDEYLGPQQIFGYECEDDDSISFPGLNILRLIQDSEIESINNIQKGIPFELPNSLSNAIYWFLCGAAYMRYIHYRKPVTMLVHTSRLTDAHLHMGNAIKRFFESKKQEDIISACRMIWEQETKLFSKANFTNQYPTYYNIQNINDYPDFCSLLPHITELIESGLTPLTVNSDNNQRTYGIGVHLCIDNSNNDENNPRLMYPNSYETPCDAPAFLVIGGNTLSRGLTIEGLISTYFLRPTGCADTLMQMGRWFGYRKGYELIPRIWLSEKVRDQFRFIAKMDQKLRNEIKFMSQIGLNPSECGPKIMNSPSTKFLQIVSNGKMQSAIGATYDFAGHTMETGVFTNNPQILNKNLKLLSEFIDSLGSPNNIERNPYAENNKIWKEVSMSKIVDFLTKYNYSERLKGFNDLKVLTKWLDETAKNGLLGNWNVILAGITPDENIGNRSITNSISINKVNRTRRYEDNGNETINIGVLRSFNDFLSDISIQQGDNETLTAIKDVKHNMAALNLLRERLNLNAPQIVIYIIDKNSCPRNNTTRRFPLQAKEDIVGFSINIPGIRQSNSTIQSLTIRIKPQFVDNVDKQ